MIVVDDHGERIEIVFTGEPSGFGYLPFCLFTIAHDDKSIVVAPAEP